MLYREVVTAFEEWFSGANKKALFVQGARQVGKTTTIREFCRTHYENLIEINFIKKPTAKRAFDGDLDADTIILNLSAMGYGLFVKGKTAVFLDEIQECPNARTAIKFLVEDGSYDYIESGSLSGVNYKNALRHPNHPDYMAYNYARGRFSANGRKSDKVRRTSRQALPRTELCSNFHCGPHRNRLSL